MHSVPLRHRLADLWIPILAAAGAVAGLAAWNPVRAGFLGACFAAAGFLVWKQGARRAAWHLLLIVLPLREPLGIDVVGTKTLYFGDLLIWAGLLVVTWEGGLRRAVRHSPSLRLGVAILALSGIGLFTATDMSGAFESIHRVVAQLAVFVVARHMVRTGADARAALLAFLAGLTPAILYGLYQSTIPVGASTLPQWAEAPIAWDATTGTAHIRVYSTFNHSLRFSHALSTGFGLAVGLLTRWTGRLDAAFLGFAVAATAICNQFTYSIGGTVATASAVVAWAILNRRRRITWVLPVLLVAWIAVAPNALFRRIGEAATGQSTSVMARVITYHQTLRVMSDHPILGVGWGGIRRSLEFDYRISKAKNIAFTAENMFLQRGLALGIPGLLISVAIAVVFFRNARAARAGPREGAGEAWPRSALLIAGTAFYVQGMFIPVGNEVSNFLLWILIAIAERGRGAAAPTGEPT